MLLILAQEIHKNPQRERNGKSPNSRFDRRVVRKRNKTDDYTTRGNQENDLKSGCNAFGELEDCLFRFERRKIWRCVQRVGCECFKLY